MWILFAFGSALFAGITAIMAKLGMEDTDSDVVTAVRTGVVLIFSWALVFAAGVQRGLPLISSRTLLFLVLSGGATGASWLCYFKALQMGDVNRVTPIDKCSTVLTMLLAFLILGEPVTGAKCVGMAGIAAGTWMMLTRRQEEPGKELRRGWFIYAALSAVFASLTSILGKIGIEGVESRLGTAVRTAVVLIMAWGIVFARGKQRKLFELTGRNMLFICLSGVTTGLSWMCYYRALQDGEASIVVPVDKLSILVTIAFSCVVLKEKLTKKSFAGLLLITAGTLALLV